MMVMKEAPMKWSVAKAREHFSELLRKAAVEPQEIYNRDRLVAAVLGPESFREVSRCMERTRRTLKESFAEMRTVLREEGYKLEIPSRKNRKNEFPRVLDELPR
jgi:hypothetical protein